MQATLLAAECTDWRSLRGVLRRLETWVTKGPAWRSLSEGTSTRTGSFFSGFGVFFRHQSS